MSHTVKLNQVIAIEKGVKSKTLRDLSDSHHLLQKETLCGGLSRTYHAHHEDGDKLPDESTKVQVKAKEEVLKASRAWAELLDIVLTKDVGNCSAKADIVVDGNVVLPDVPVTTLLFLEKTLTEVHTFVKKLPVLNPADEWKLDSANSLYRTDPVRTLKTSICNNAS